MNLKARNDSIIKEVASSYGNLCLTSTYIFTCQSYNSFYSNTALSSEVPVVFRASLWTRGLQCDSLVGVCKCNSSSWLERKIASFKAGLAEVQEGMLCLARKCGIFKSRWEHVIRTYRPGFKELCWPDVGKLMESQLCSLE